MTPATLPFHTQHRPNQRAWPKGLTKGPNQGAWPKGLTKGPKAGRAVIPFLSRGWHSRRPKQEGDGRDTGQFTPQDWDSDSSWVQLVSNLGVSTCELTASEDLRANTGVKQRQLWTRLCLDLGLSAPPLHRKTGWEDAERTKASLVFNHVDSAYCEFHSVCLSDESAGTWAVSWCLQLPKSDRARRAVVTKR